MRSTPSVSGHSLVGDKKQETAPNKLIVFTDFDGTLTGLPGRSLMTHQFYEYVSDKCINEAGIRNEEKIQKAFAKLKTESPQSPIFMSKDAVEFLHGMLARPNVKVNIISRNVRWYIEAVLKYQGFTPDEMGRLTIMGPSPHKGKAVELLCKKQLEDSTQAVYVLDDDPRDRTAMEDAVRSARPSLEEVYVPNQKAGEFQWGLYLRTIQNGLPTIQCPPQSQAVPVAVNSSEVKNAEQGAILICKLQEVFALVDCSRVTLVDTVNTFRMVLEEQKHALQDKQPIDCKRLHSHLTRLRKMLWFALQKAAEDLIQTLSIMDPNKDAGRRTHLASILLPLELEKGGEVDFEKLKALKVYRDELETLEASYRQARQGTTDEPVKSEQSPAVIETPTAISTRKSRAVPTQAVPVEVKPLDVKNAKDGKILICKLQEVFALVDCSRVTLVDTVNTFRMVLEEQKHALQNKQPIDCSRLHSHLTRLRLMLAFALRKAAEDSIQKLSIMDPNKDGERRIHLASLLLPLKLESGEPIDFEKLKALKVYRDELEALEVGYRQARQRTDEPVKSEQSPAIVETPTAISTRESRVARWSEELGVSPTGRSLFASTQNPPAETNRETTRVHVNGLNFGATS